MARQVLPTFKGQLQPELQNGWFNRKPGVNTNVKFIQKKKNLYKTQPYMARTSNSNKNENDLPHPWQIYCNLLIMISQASMMNGLIAHKEKKDFLFWMKAKMTSVQSMTHTSGQFVRHNRQTKPMKGGTASAVWQHSEAQAQRQTNTHRHTLLIPPLPHTTSLWQWLLIPPAASSSTLAQIPSDYTNDIIKRVPVFARAHARLSFCTF